MDFEVFGMDITTLFIMVFGALVVGLILWKVFKIALKTAIFAALIVAGIILVVKVFEIF